MAETIVVNQRIPDRLMKVLQKECAALDRIMNSKVMDSRMYVFLITLFVARTEPAGRATE